MGTLCKHLITAPIRGSDKAKVTDVFRNAQFILVAMVHYAS